MENKNAKIYVASVKNVSSRLEHYGDVNIDNISLLKLIYKYSCYCSTYDQLQRMNTMVSQLQNSDPLICSEIQATRGADYVNVFQVVETSGVDSPNQPPTISNTSFTVTAEDDTFTFSENQIYNGYSDLEGTIPGDFTIASLPFIGTLTYAGVPVVIDTLYSVPGLLVYTRGSDESNSDSFTWTVFDKDTQLPLESNVATMSGIIEEKTSTNEDPYVGDRAKYAGNRVTTVFTLADFTTDTINPFNDPEGDSLAAIKILEVSEANTGVYYFFGDVLVADQEITSVEISSGALYHVGPDANSVTTDSFRCAVKDDSLDADWVE